MMSNGVKSLIFLLAGGSLALGAGSSFAQSRGQSRLSTLGSGQVVGGSSRTRVFSNYSYGLGGLQAPTVSAGTSVLQSSIGRGTSFSISRPDVGAVSSLGGRVIVLAPKGMRLSSASGDYIQNVSGGGGLSQALMSMDTSAIGAARSYMSTIGATDAALKSRDHPVTSLVPDEPSRYREFMEKGEKAFKAGEFRLAYQQFKLANHIGGKDPESLLSLAHAGFATSIFSYNQAAFHLRRALTVLPEVPLVPLQPKAFYGETPAAAERYAEHQMRLEDHLRQSPADAEAQLLLAYFRWFEGDIPAARTALAKAARLARNIRDDEMLEAVGVFWDGMVASGKVSGELEATATSSGTATQPASR